MTVDELNAYISHGTARGAAGGLLSGATFAVKDNIDVAGSATTAGTAMLVEVADLDAVVVTLLRRAGASVAGKTNMHELAFGVTSNNATYGPVRNPVDPRFSAGGSSGGSAVVVARGDVRFALATDTGGSVTVPASFCGVVGFRPTTGRYPADGVVRLSSTRDTIGLHTRTVADARLIDSVIVREPRVTRPDIRGVVLGVPRSRYDDLDPAVDAVAESTLERLRAAGVVLIDVDLPGTETGEELVLFEAAALLLERSPGMVLAEFAERIASPDVRRIVSALAATPVTAAAYESALADRGRLRAAYADVLSGVDALIMPSVPVLPPPAGVDDVVALGGRLEPLFPTITRNTAPGTTAGVPMLTLPAGRSAGGLPIGMTLEGAASADARLLTLGEALEPVIVQASRLG